MDRVCDSEAFERRKSFRSYKLAADFMAGHVFFFNEQNSKAASSKPRGSRRPGRASPDDYHIRVHIICR
jgi:hypothetical protein